MAIQELHVAGFRSLRDVVWKPGKLNLFVGPNGSGKSNLLRLLELIGQTASGHLSNAVSSAGGMVPLLWNSTATDFGWRLRLDPVDEGRDRVKDAITYEFTLQQLGMGSSYQVVKDDLSNLQAAETPLRIFERRPNRSLLYDQRAGNLVELKDFDENESLLGQIADPANPIPLRARREIESWRIHHDIHADRSAPMRQPATTQYAKFVSADGDNLTNVLHTLYTEDREFKREIDDAMRAAFGADYGQLEFPPAAAQQVQLAVSWKSCRKPHMAPELSDGTLRFLLLVTVLASPHPAPLIAIDEPETGLHPRMLSLVAEYASAASDRTQVILTSHSPEFLDCFSSHEPLVTVFHWEEGETRVFPLAPDRLRDWLRHYRLGKLFTSGELDLLSLPPVDADAELIERLKNLPPEDSGVPAT